MAKAKAKTRGVNLPVPQSREEAIATLAAVGAHQRELERIETGMNADLSRIKEEAETAATPIREALTAKVEGLKIWAEANRAALTDDGKSKSAQLGTGKIGWRLCPPAVSLRGVESILKSLKDLGLSQFIREKHEVNKEAMLADPDRAKAIAGVSIGSKGEEFFVEPFAAELAEAS